MNYGSQSFNDKFIQTIFNYPCFLLLVDANHHHHLCRFNILSDSIVFSENILEYKLYYMSV